MKTLQCSNYRLKYSVKDYIRIKVRGEGYVPHAYPSELSPT